MKWLPATACAVLISSFACGNGQSRIESPARPDGDKGKGGELDTFDTDPRGAELTDNGNTEDPWADETEHPPGAQRIDPAAFVTFLGFEYGQDMKKISGLLPEHEARLGRRIEMDMAGSVGYKFEGHLAAAWDVNTKRIEFLSIRSEDAIHYLAANGRRDEKLLDLWGVSPGVAHGLLGKPTQVVNRPHAVTYRYDFLASNNRHGTASLEFSKLVDPVRCSTVSVHWYY